jgi:quinol-cytochrome oxidoreductase complex cytochrome b subunit
MWIVIFILAIILLTVCISADSEVLPIIDNLLIAILVIGTGLPTVAMFAVDKLAASHQGCIREVQCFRG